MDISYSKHAEARRQQRRLPPAIIQWLFEFGAVEPQDGAELLHFDKDARSRLGRALGDQIVGCLGKFMDAYAVVSNGQVVTVGYRYKRIRTR